MNNKIKSKVNSVLVLSFTTAIFGYPSYLKTMSELSIKPEKIYSFSYSRKVAFLPVLRLKKNPLTL